MKMKAKRLGAWLLCVLLLSVLSFQSMAAGAIDTKAPASLSVSFLPDGIPASGVEFRLYQVAEVSANCEFTLTDRFSACPVELDGHDAQSWRVLATTLMGYVVSDGLAPDYFASTNADGAASFSDLPTGLYLVEGDGYYRDSVYYRPTPFLICLPDRDAENNWQYDLEVHVKYTSHLMERPVEVEVMKVWDDNMSPERPSQIAAELYCNSVLYDTVILNKENNWRYIWSGLSSDASWYVHEADVPKGYTVKVEQQDDCYVLINSKPAAPPAPDDPELPQTGMLWWPVPVLLAAGLLLVVLGVLRRRGGEYE